jgi:hypothetical protein
MNTPCELLIRILCDIRPSQPVDAAYLYCQTAENQESVFQAADFIVRHSLASEIWILDTEEKGGYPGFSIWKRHLVEKGIDPGCIVGVASHNKSELHTRIESKALIRFAKNQGCEKIYVAAAPFQQFRAYMTAVTLALEEFPELFIYSFPGVALPWRDEVFHSQGKLRAARCSLIHEELKRIEIYQNKKDLALFDPVLQYMNQRDASDMSEK